MEFGNDILQEFLMRLFVSTSMCFVWGCLPAAALDCTKAETADEKAICQTPALLAQDEKVNAAFKKIMAAASPEAKDNLRKSQRLWLRNDRNCDGDFTCLDKAMERRLRAFSASAATGPGTGAAITFTTFANDAPDWSVLEGPRFQKEDQPYQVAWNRAFDTAVELRKQNPTPPVDEDLGDGPDGHNFASDEFSITFASPTLLSGSQYSNTYNAGAAHPEWTETKINLHVPSGKVVMFEDMIVTEKTDALVHLCAKQSETGGGVTDDDLPALKSAVTDLTYWSFFDTEVSLTFPPYTIGGYNQAISGCKFTAAELKEFMQKSFKAWP
jgi:uncharacterized protein